MPDETVEPRPDEAPGSYVSADAGIPLPGERTDATPGDTYEGVRDNEQLGRPRSSVLRAVQEVAPPAAEGAQIQNDQIGRQRVGAILEEEEAVGIPEGTETTGLGRPVIEDETPLP